MGVGWGRRCGYSKSFFIEDINTKHATVDMKLV